MRLRRLPLKGIIFILACLAAGTVGGLVLQTCPGWGSLLILLGALGTVWTFIADEIRHNETEAMVETENAILMRSGIGNPYVEKFFEEVRRTGTCEAGVKYLRKATSVHPNDPLALPLLAEVLAIATSSREAVLLWRNVPANMLSEANNLAKLALKIAPNNYMSYDAMGIVCDIKRQHKKARRFFQIGAEHGSPGTRTLMSTSWGMAGNDQKALEEIESHIKESNDHDWWIHFYHGRALLHVGRYNDALRVLKIAQKRMRFRFELLLCIQEAYYMQAFLFPAVGYKFVAALVALPFSVRTFLRLAGESTVHLCIAIMSKVSRPLWPLVRSVPILSRLFVFFFPPSEPEATLGCMLCARHHFQLAQRHLEKATRVRPSDAHSWGNLGLCYMALGDTKRALRAMDISLKLEPNNPVFKSNREACVTASNGKYCVVIPATSLLTRKKKNTDPREGQIQFKRLRKAIPSTKGPHPNAD